MKCPLCKAYSDVLETRKRMDNTTRRRYVCGNMHRFTTIETIVKYDKPPIEAVRQVRN
jgi:transcriptional regulator NrdR family protein